MIGVYIIENLVNGKCYIGSSNNIEIRFRHHKKELRGKYHANGYLQRAWNKYKENSFSFRILEQCDLVNLRNIEQKYITKHMTFIRSLGYNLNEMTTGGPNKKFFNCKVKNCKRQYLASGYCNMHYRRFNRNGSASKNKLKVIRRYQKLCKIINCGNKHDSHGYCQRHAYYYRKYGRVTRFSALQRR